MSYNVLGNFQDLTELKTRIGSPVNQTMCTVVDSPSTGGWSAWLWDNASTSTSDDITIVTPTARIGIGGRWTKVATYQVNADWTASGTYAEILHKPTLFDGAYASLTGKPTLFSGAYSDLSGKPSLFSGNYNDLTNKPTIPTGQVNSDWSASSGVAQILNKPALFSGAYADLTGKPTIPAAQVNVSWTATTGVQQILNKPTLATVATSGSYTDLINKPVIPTAVKEYMGTANVTSAGNVVFYLTDTGLSGGTALFTNVSIVLPIVNDSALNYTYGWTVSVDKKTLTVNCKNSAGINVALLGLTLLGTPANVANGTSVSVLVKGN